MRCTVTFYCFDGPSNNQSSTSAPRFADIWGSLRKTPDVLNLWSLLKLRGIRKEVVKRRYPLYSGKQHVKHVLKLNKTGNVI